jgi:hypothetical protein
MTSKDYEALAQIIKEAEPQTDLSLRIAVFKLADYQYRHLNEEA